jgi:hypothetical protein
VQLRSNEREQVEPRDVFAASVLVDYFKAHARRVFAEVHGADPVDSLAVALNEFLEEHDGKWEGTATELFGAHADSRLKGCPPTQTTGSKGSGDSQAFQEP